MTALSVHLPEKLAKASQEIAEQMGISRTQFIRQALVHEIENYHLQRERDELIKSFKFMKKQAPKLKELEKIDKGFDGNDLPEDEEQWWKGK